MGGPQIRSAMLCIVNENITYTRGVVISVIAGMVEISAYGCSHPVLCRAALRIESFTQLRMTHIMVYESICNF